MNRILFEPLPGTATEADLIRIVERERRLCELVNGTLVEKPVGLLESVVAARLIRRLGNVVEPNHSASCPASRE